MNGATAEDRADRRVEIRERIEEALLAIFASGDFARLNHDRLAEDAGTSRRTVYRHFPNREALTRALLAKLTRATGAGALPPRNEAAMLAGLADRFRTFDRNASLTMIAMTSPEGRAARNATSAERARAYRAVMADATRGQSGPDRTQAAAVVQLLGSGLAWREMRDQWHLPADQIAAACRWAIEVLLADLRARGGKPLSEGPAR